MNDSKTDNMSQKRQSTKRVSLGIFLVSLLIAFIVGTRVQFIGDYFFSPYTNKGSQSLSSNLDLAETQKVYDISTFGLKPDTHKNASPVLQKALSKIKAECKDGEAVILRFSEGRYDFHEKGAAVREYYISNHDQDNPK